MSNGLNAAVKNGIYIKTPIIYFDNRDTLDDNFLRILHSANVENPIFILTSSQNVTLLAPSDHYQIVPIDDLPGYQEIEKKFTVLYKHLSTNSVKFEMSCFLRFFATECLMNMKQLNRVWMLDCDVWPSKSIAYFENTNSVFLSPDYFDKGTISCHSSLFGADFLTEFNKFLMNSFYTEMLPQLVVEFETLRNSNLSGGISDMTAMGKFLEATKTNIRWSNSNTIGSNGYYLSHTMSRLYLDLGKSSKNIILIIRTRKCFIAVSGKSYRKYASLHFQGHDKFLIPIIQRFGFLLGNQGFLAIQVKISRKLSQLNLFK